MAKAKKKTAKEGSQLFYNIIGASVSGNPKSQKNNHSTMQDELRLLREDWAKKTSKRMKAEEGIAFLEIKIGEINPSEVLRLSQILDTAKKEERIAAKTYKEAFSLALQQKHK